jgi:Hypothetical glycosyl hydrolase family 15
MQEDHGLRSSRWPGRRDLTALGSFKRGGPVVIAIAVAASGHVALPLLFPSDGREARSASAAVVSQTPGGSQASGEVRFVRVADSRFDRYTADSRHAGWFRRHFWRMVTFAPYFDSRLSWFRDAWAYSDLYAIYAGSSLASSHPEWILRDAAGRRLYIPWGCSEGTCPQYAGDVGNPAFRAFWIRQARSTLARGYRGLFIDDVNLLRRVGNGEGREVAPVDPRTGDLMSLSRWRRYVAEFTEEIREAFPRAELVHNALWFAGRDRFVRRQVAAADMVNLERGVNDSGLRGGGGRYGFETFLSYIDRLHERGVGVILQDNVTAIRRRRYALASYFLINSGRDAISNHSGSRPGDWWPGYGVSLGVPRGPRYGWRRVLRRDFQRGFVLVNPPDAPAVSLRLERRPVDLAGRPRGSVTLGPAGGVVLRWRR